LRKSIVIILAVAILIASFLVFTRTPYVHRAYAYLKSSLGGITLPSLQFFEKPGSAFRYVFDTYLNVVGARKENVLLKKKLDTLQLENQRLAELEKENKRLKTLLNFKQQNTGNTIAARVTGEDLKNWFRCIILDKGKDYGVREKMPVITPQGIVGQAVEVGKWYAKVMVINDANSSVDVYVEGKNTRGILEGTGQTVLKLKYIVKNDEIEIGDRLVTSGKDTIFPRGLPAGIVITVNRNKPGIFADIDVMPYNNFKRLDEVLVVMPR
jgi:rod shape-determining protein MreC